MNTARAENATRTPTMPAPRKSKKKPRAARARLTHLEVRRGDTLRLRISIADDALAEIGDELGALIKRIAPGTQTSIVPAIDHEAPMAEAEPVTVQDFIVSQQHANDDETYHASLREYFAGLIGSLCDTSLADALEIARAERERRSEGGN
jgi:hypothetical protein